MFFGYGTITRSGTPFQDVSPKQTLSKCSPSGYSRRHLLTTPRVPRSGICGVWALPFSLAATKGINDCFLFLRLLRCFTSAGVAPYALAGRAIPFLAGLGFPIRKSPDQRLLDTSPRLIAVTPRPSSLLISQGIHHLPLKIIFTFG